MSNLCIYEYIIKKSTKKIGNIYFWVNKMRHSGQAINQAQKTLKDIDKKFENDFV